MLTEMVIRRTAAHSSKWCRLLSPLSLVVIGTPDALTYSFYPGH